MEIGRITVQGLPRKKVSETPSPSQQISQVWWFTPVISVTWET
jgi:hypothetical protein